MPNGDMGSGSVHRTALMCAPRPGVPRVHGIAARPMRRTAAGVALGVTRCMHVVTGVLAIVLHGGSDQVACLLYLCLTPT